MPHLPNEVWLLIASYCSAQDLWLSLRPVNNQLQQCTEQHVKQEILPRTTLTLPVVIPTYDVRVPIRGRVVFHPMPQDCGTAMDNFGSASYSMVDTEPDYYRPHFLTRWATMQDRETGRLDERRIRWEFELEGQRRPVNLHRPVALRQGCKEGDVQVSSDWRFMMTGFFKGMV